MVNSKDQSRDRIFLIASSCDPQFRGMLVINVATCGYMSTVQSFLL